MVSRADYTAKSNSPAVICWAVGQRGYNNGCIVNTASITRLTTAPQGAFVLSPETTVNLCGGSGYIPPHDIPFFRTPDPTIMGSKKGHHHGENLGISTALYGI